MNQSVQYDKWLQNPFKKDITIGVKHELKRDKKNLQKVQLINYQIKHTLYLVPEGFSYGNSLSYKKMGRLNLIYIYIYINMH